MLEFLTLNTGRLINKDELIDAVWDGRAVTDGAVGKCIEGLRAAFGEDGWQYLQNVRGRGYIFDIDAQPTVLARTESDSEQIDVVRVIVEEENSDLETISRHLDVKTHSAWRVATVAVVIGWVALLAVAGAYWLKSLRKPVTNITSIAVLPLQNESGNNDVEYLSDVMTESLINSLSRLPGLTVKSRNSVFQYKDTDQNPQSIASALSVQAVLSGRFVQRGDEVTLYVSLVDGHSGNQIWGEQYKRKLDQVASLERETASDIAQRLNSKLLPADKKRLSRGGTENSEAYLSYLKGRYYWNNPGRDGFEKSLEFFQKAIDLDPTFSLGYAGLAHYYGYAAATGGLPPEENWRRSEAATRKALELDDQRAETYNVLSGIQLYHQRDWSAAEHSFKRGLELNTNSAETRRHYAKCLALFGRNDEALAEINRTLELEPLSVPHNVDAGRILFWSGHYSQAVAQLHNALDLAPNSVVAHDVLGSVYKKMGDQKRAVDEWSKVLALTGNEDLALRMKNTFERSGFEAALRLRGEHRLRELSDQLKKGIYVASGEFVTAYTMIGDNEKALMWLEKAVQERNRFALEFKIDPTYDRLRRVPRFQQLADEVKVS